MTSRSLYRIVPFAAGLVLAVGILHLIVVRAEHGDVFPRYSSLRRDPLGTAALYEALNALPGIRADRHHAAPQALEATPDTLLLVLNLDPRAPMSRESVAAIESVAGCGGRVFIGLRPVGRRLPAPKPPVESEDGPAVDPEDGGGAEPEDAGGADRDPAPAAPEPGGEEPFPGMPAPGIAPETAWGFRLEPLPARETDETVSRPAIRPEEAPFPDFPNLIAVHAAAAIRPSDDAWRPLYTADGDPVVMSRRIGRGTLFVATESYLLSNEALRSDRNAAFISALLGPCTRVVFEERHLGFTEKRGIVALARGYGLHGLAVALPLLAILFVWSGLPVHVAETDPGGPGARAAGRDSAGGLISLLRRAIPAGELPAECWRTWRNTAAEARSLSPEKIAEIEQILADRVPLRRGDAVAAERYRQICAVIERKE